LEKRRKKGKIHGRFRVPEAAVDLPRCHSIKPACAGSRGFYFDRVAGPAPS